MCTLFVETKCFTYCVHFNLKKFKSNVVNAWNIQMFVWIILPVIINGEQLHFNKHIMCIDLNNSTTTRALCILKAYNRELYLRRFKWMTHVNKISTSRVITLLTFTLERFARYTVYYYVASTIKTGCKRW